MSSTELSTKLRRTLTLSALPTLQRAYSMFCSPCTVLNFASLQWCATNTLTDASVRQAH